MFVVKSKIKDSVLFPTNLTKQKKYLTLKNTIDCFKSKGKQIHKTSNNSEIEFATVGQSKAASNLWKPIKQ